MSSFHSISFPSKWGVGKHTQQRTRWNSRFSIQLVSPTSGETPKGFKVVDFDGRFHSISFPNEWGDAYLSGTKKTSNTGFHSISFPNEWGGKEVQTDTYFYKFFKCFHSISFPNEWGASLVHTSHTLAISSCFHSISFPNEWGGSNLIAKKLS